LLNPKGVITVTDIFNRTAAEFQLDSQNVLPEAIRTMSATWDSAFLLGKYDAQITLTYGVNNEQIVTATTTFWAVPYKNKAFLIGVAVFLFVVFVSVRWLKRLKMAFRVLFGRN